MIPFLNQELIYFSMIFFSLCGTVDEEHHQDYPRRVDEEY